MSPEIGRLFIKGPQPPTWLCDLGCKRRQINAESQNLTLYWLWRSKGQTNWNSGPLHCSLDLPTYTKSRCENPGLGNVLLQHAPFLRMYADYVRNFDQAMELVRTWTERSSAFRNIIQDIQVQDSLGRVHIDSPSCAPKSAEVWARSSVCILPFLESGGVRQPDPAAPHVGTSPEGSTLWDAAQGLPEETARG